MTFRQFMGITPSLLGSMKTPQVCMAIALTAALLPGCASLDEPGFEIPRGTPISQDQMPDTLRAKLNLPQDVSVECYGDDPSEGSYRIEYKSGKVIIVDSDGAIQGMVF
ncbi:MAG: hypothetical protein AAFX06_30760 [Planctomycetota bacterium]